MKLSELIEKMRAQSIGYFAALEALEAIAQQEEDLVMAEVSRRADIWVAEEYSYGFDSIEGLYITSSTALGKLRDMHRRYGPIDDARLARALDGGDRLKDKTRA